MAPILVMLGDVASIFSFIFTLCEHLFVNIALSIYTRLKYMVHESACLKTEKYQ